VTASVSSILGEFVVMWHSAWFVSIFREKRMLFSTIPDHTYHVSRYTS